jgi:hypothetical protein
MLKPIEKIEFSVDNPDIPFDQLLQIDKNTFNIILKINELIEIVNYLLEDQQFNLDINRKAFESMIKKL